MVETAKETKAMAEPAPGETATEGKDLDSAQAQTKNRDVSVEPIATPTLGDDDATVQKREAQINQRVGPAVPGSTMSGYEFPIPEDRKPAVMPADQKPK